MAFLAALPILIILVLMIGFRWGAARAGAAGYLSALVVALAFFGARETVLAYAHTKALVLAADVLFIIWAAFLLYRVADEAGAIHAIGEALPGLTPDKGMQALLIGWVFASFLQGAGGFGVPVAVVAPLLTGLGFTPLAAVLIPSIGHGWAVTFGSLGSSFNALLSASGLNAAMLAPPSALFLGLACLLTGPMVAHAAGGWPVVKRTLAPAILIGVVMAAAQFAVAAGVGLWNLGAFVAGLVGLVFCIWVVRARSTGTGRESRSGMPVPLALTAYLVLITLTVLILLVPPISKWMGRTVFAIPFPETTTSLGYISPAGTNRPIHVFTHAGAILSYSALIAFLIYQRSGLYQNGSLRRILHGTLQSMMSSSVSILEMVAMATIMSQCGMTEALAQGLATLAGAAFPVIAPWIGAIGAFMTGSNTNSNVVFASLQLRTAQLLSYNPAIILAAQTAGAALASVAAPTKVVVGASTAGMAGKEGEVLRALIGYTLLLVLFISILSGIGILLTT
jgi:lactate permease